MKIIQTSEEMPKPEKLSGSSGTYYLVFIENYGNALAMFLKDKHGQTAWYTSYVSVIVRNVYAWARIEGTN